MPRTQNSLPNRTPDQVEEHRRLIIKLVRKGWTKAMIAEWLTRKEGRPVSRSLVSKDYKFILTQYRKDWQGETKEYVAAKLEEYAEVKRQAWRAWRRSKQDAEAYSKETAPEVSCAVCDASGLRMGRNGSTFPCGNCNGTGRLGGVLKETHERSGRCGEAKYLAVVLECLKAERELLALNPPREMRLDATTANINWDVFTGGIPAEGPVPDRVEQEIARAMGAEGVAALPAPPPYANGADAVPDAEIVSPAPEAPLLPGEHGAEGNGTAH